MSYDVIVIGAGVIGLSSAFRCAQLGLNTLVLERGTRSRGASYVAGGMLAPVTEAWFGQRELVRMNLESARRFPGFVAEIEELSGVSVGASAHGTLYVALDRDQSDALHRLHGLHSELGLDSRPLDGPSARELEPALHPSVRSALSAEEDRSVDPRALLDALSAAVASVGVEVRAEMEVTAIRPGGLVELGAQTISARQVVIAAGAWSGLIPGAPDSVAEHTRPVKGQIVRLRSGSEPMPVTRTIRTEEVYLVPRATGELAVGATSEEKGFEIDTTAGGVFELLRAAVEVVPAVREMTWVEVSAALRPATSDGLPLIGPTEVEGVIAACGHYRNGILLSALTADAVAQTAAKGEPPPEVAAADPRRLA